MSKTTVDHKRGPTAMMPVTTMEEVPLLNDEGRAEMLASLKDAEARVAAGQYTEYDPETFKSRLLATYRAAKATKTA